MYLGIDLGTSGLKLLLLNTRRQVLASVDAPLALQRPHPTWSEQHPADWWQGLQDAVAQLRAWRSWPMVAVRSTCASRCHWRKGLSPCRR